MLGKEAKIMLAGGSGRNVEDIRVGDKLMGENGEAVVVTALSRPSDNLYAIKADDGYEFSANSEHRLVVQNRSGKRIDIAVHAYLRANEKKRNFYRLIRFEDIKGRPAISLLGFKVSPIGRGRCFDLEVSGRYRLGDGTLDRG